MFGQGQELARDYIFKDLLGTTATAQHIIAVALALLLPDLRQFNVIDEVVAGTTIPAWFLWRMTGIAMKLAPGLLGQRGHLQHQGLAVGLLAPAVAVAVTVAEEVQQGLGAGRVTDLFGQLGIFGVDRADMVVFAHGAQTRNPQFQHHRIVHSRLNGPKKSCLTVRIERRVAGSEMFPQLLSRWRQDEPR